MEILAFFAHPDDETILAGGTLALLARFGHNVHYLIATRGEGGECGDPPLCNREELGRFREGESKAAIKALGGKSLNFMNYVDPVVGPHNELFSFSNEIDPVLAALTEMIQKNKIEIIISHGSNGEYGHPAHRMVYSVVETYFHQKARNLYWYTAQAHFASSLKPHLTNKDDNADWVVDVSSVLDRKINAARAHQTQHALFVRRKKIELKREVFLEEVIVAEESYRFAAGSHDILQDLFSKQHILRNVDDCSC